MTHTPTRGMRLPWHDMGYEVQNGDGETVAISNHHSGIVKCVNMHDEMVGTIKELLKVYNEPDGSVCCNGFECGCYGASVRQQAEYYAKETLKKAGSL